MRGSIHQHNSLPTQRQDIERKKKKMNVRSERGSGQAVTASTSDYEDVRRDRTGWPKSTIDTKKNCYIAYGQGHTVSTTVSQ